MANAAHDQFLPSPGPPSSERLLPLFVKGTLKGDVFLHGGVQQPRFLRSVGHGTSLPGKSREGVGRHSQGFILRGSCQDDGLDQGKGWHSAKTGVGVGGCAVGRNQLYVAPGGLSFLRAESGLGARS